MWTLDDSSKSRIPGKELERGVMQVMRYYRLSDVGFFVSSSIHCSVILIRYYEHFPPLPASSILCL